MGVRGMWEYLCSLCRPPGSGESGPAGGRGPGDQGEAWWPWFGSWADVGSNPGATYYLKWVTLGVTPLSEPPFFLGELPGVAERAEQGARLTLGTQGASATGMALQPLSGAQSTPTYASL